ncbi:MAG TPA: histidine kinase dimerization/phosphoacceptor domain -containing protein [Devosia sp.]
MPEVADNLSKKLAPVRATVVFAVACLACFVVLVTWVLVQSYMDTIRQAETRARAFSQVVAANAALLVEGSYQALRRMDLAVGDTLNDSSSTAVEELDDAVANLPANVRAWIIDADGRPRLSNTDQPNDFSVADRDYFKGVKDGDVFRISPLMVSRSAGDPVIAIAKRIERQQGFVGAATVIIPANFLDRLREGLDLGPGSTLGLIRADGMLVTRSPIPADTQDLSQYVLFTEHLKKADDGTYFAESPTDGLHRIVGYRRVPGYPLVAVASISQSEALESFWQTVGVLVAFSIPGLIGLGIFALWTVRSQMALATASAEKEVLLREIHHRVKNNLQQVLSLLGFQPIPDETKRVLEGRVAAMVAVHEQMYRSEQMVRIDLGEFLPRLLAGIKESFARPVDVTFDVPRIEIDRELAQPIALIVNEAVANAIKHAWPDDRQDARIDIAVRLLDDGRGRLTIRDNGVGFDPEAKTGGMGRRLVKSLERQIGATSTHSFDNGTSYELDFPLLLKD